MDGHSVVKVRDKSASLSKGLVKERFKINGPVKVLGDVWIHLSMLSLIAWLIKSCQLYAPRCCYFSARENYEWKYSRSVSALGLVSKLPG